MIHFGLVAQTNTENWVKTTTYKVPTTVVANPSSAQKVINVSYFDGLGNPFKTWHTNNPIRAKTL